MLSLPAEPYSHPHLCCQIESLEGGLQVLLSILRRYINSRKSSIYRLHPELFQVVASHLGSESDLVRATHVSYHWRNTLHAHPSLWAHLDFQYVGRALEFLKRSKAAPLHVYLLGDGKTPPSIKPLLPHATRIVTLGLVDRPGQMELLSHPMPSLRRLEITNSFYHEGGEEEDGDGDDNDDNNDDDNDDDNDDNGDDGDDETVSWSFPSVTSLAVHNTYQIPFHTPHLTCFKFRCVRPMYDAYIAGSLLDFLRDCPLLEDLEISYIEDIGTYDQAVSLPNLRSYTQAMLPGHGVYSLGVFNMLSIPPPCAVTLKSWTTSDIKSKATDILPPFKNPGYLAGVCRVKLSMEPKESYPVGFVFGALELINGHGARVCLEREMRVSDTYQRTYVRDLMDDDMKLGLLNCLKVLRTHSVEILCIEVDDLWDDEAPAIDAVREALVRFGDIKTLILSCAAVRPCLLALERETGPDKDGQQFPQLQTLVIHSRYQDGPSWIDTLRTILPVARGRKVAGCPFESVSVFLQDAPSLRECEGKVEELEGLRRCVKRFGLTTGDDVSDWDIDEFFLDGLEHLRNRRNVQWELEDDGYYV